MIKGPHAADRLHAMDKKFVYHGAKTKEISFPLGGIGTGSIGLAGNGMLIDWEIFNRPNKNGSMNAASFFAIKAERGDRPVLARLLQGDWLGSYNAANKGAPSYYVGHGSNRENAPAMPHFRRTAFTGMFPIAEVAFEDEADLLAVTLEAFNPFIPLNDRDSSIPCAIFRYRVRNVFAVELDIGLAACIANPHQVQAVNTLVRDGGMTGIRLSSEAYGSKDPAYGDVTVATDQPDVSWQTCWKRTDRFENPLELFWDEFTAPGRLTDRTYDEPHTHTDINPLLHIRSTGALCAHRTLQPGEETVFSFCIAWSFPNFVQYWNPILAEDGTPDLLRNKWRNYYASQYADSVAAAAYAFAHLPRLYGDTKRFRDSLFASTVPDSVLEAVSANLATLKSTTCLRLEDGSFYGFEGSHCTEGACEGSCTHVWNYAQSLPWLFPELDRSMIELNYRYNLQPGGKMRFRLMLPLGRDDAAARKWDDYYAATDGQLTFVSRVYKHYLMTGDLAWLQGMWPLVRRSLAYAWSADNADRWDPDRSGVLTGVQHNTLDKEMVGPNPALTSQYVLALRCAATIGRLVGADEGEAEAYERMAANGGRFVDERLFNGAFYVERSEGYGERFPGKRFFAFGDGCYVDQVVGQWYAHMLGLGYLLDRDHVRSALDAVYERNFLRAGDLVNAWRVYALDDEWGVALCRWEEGRKPERPIPYHSECWTGLEYQLASHLVYEGRIDEALSVVRAVRDRYDGEKRNPWGECEFGNHYARAMSSYALLHAFGGFRYDAGRGVMTIAPNGSRHSCRMFWCCGGAWGEWRADGDGLRIDVHYGAIRLGGIESNVWEQTEADCMLAEAAGASPACGWSAELAGTRPGCRLEGRTLRFAEPASIRAGETLRVRSMGGR